MMMNNSKNKRRQQQQASYGQGVGDDVCCFHPREVVVGVCAHCLKERLLLLLAAAAPPSDRRTESLPKQVLALGSSFLQRLDSTTSRHHHRPCYYSDDDTISAASLDDSFISIKFEDNGKATWDSSKQPSMVVVADPHQVNKRGGVTLTRWRKQVVGRLLQLARWKTKKHAAAAGERSSKHKHSSSGRAGWIRTLTTRRRHADRPWS